ncbi:MAG TPA: anthranilate phosphoribosyltransferase [Chloroflexota bacterium]|nr:anthranilate phosphoribosyltransferase [Chloroflexota bacterium]
MIREAIAKVVDGHSLEPSEAEEVMQEILEGTPTPAQFGALMLALRLKGETPEELAGFATAMRSRATRVTTHAAVVDTCGTGGDGAHTFNISTVAALAVAATGQAVAKHGNRAMSSVCGSADVLEGLGVNIQLGPERVAASIAATCFGFMFAPLYHPSMRFANPLRREIGVRTAFNLLGPLTNPASARRQLLGVPNHATGEKLSQTLALLGADHALVVCGEGSMDELTLTGASEVWEVRGTDVQRYALTPEQFGLQRCDPTALNGGDVATNVAIAQRVLAGEAGPQLDVVALSAGAALYAADAVPTIAQGIDSARQAIASGAAACTLQRVVEFGAGA